MSQGLTDKRVGWLVGISIFLVTVVVTPNWTIDPINLPKLLVLSSISFSLFTLLLLKAKKIFSKESLPPTLTAFALPVSMAISMFQSGSSISQQIFGIYGRNNGFLNYFCLSVIFLAVATMSERSIKRPFLIGTIGALSLNCAYGLFQAFGKDWIDWVNSYSPVFGTLGNPDFASAFLGFGTAFAFGYLFSKDTTLIVRICCLIYLPLSIFVIYKSKSQQGIVVLAIVLVIVIFFEIRNNLKSFVPQIIYIIGISALFIISIAGMLQKGPLTNILYRSSVTQRGDYWHAGLEMLWNNPVTGVGLDSYGDWYRYFRDIAAAERFNGSVVSNSAHNVFIDIASTSGIFAILSYFILLFLALRSSWIIFRNSKKLDPFFISVFAAWIGYLAQSLISINNIGLGIWGWVLPGLLIANERWNSLETIDKKRKNKSRPNQDYTSLIMNAGLAIGFIIGFIPFNADANFRHAIQSGNPENVYSAALSRPTDPSRMLYAAKIFKANNLNDKAESLLRKLLSIYPRSFESWQLLYELPTTTSNEKAAILSKLKSLDPNNKNIK